MFANGMGIGGKHRFPSGKGTNKHQQRGLREVEVSQKTAHNLKSISGREKNTGLPGVRVQRLSLSDRCAVL